MSVTITQGPRGTVTVSQAARQVNVTSSSRGTVTITQQGSQGIPGPVSPMQEGAGIDVVGYEIRLDIAGLPTAPGA